MINYTRFDDTLLVNVCERFLVGESPRVIADWLQQVHDPNVTRENIYPLLREARKRGFLSVLPPPDGHLQQRICDRYDLEMDRVNVLRVRGDTARDYLADAAAERIVKLIHEVGRDKKRVSIGLGGGITIMKVAHALASRLRAESALPDLTLHAVTSGFDVRQPWTAPVCFLAYFEGVAQNIEFVALFAPAVVEANEYEKTIKGQGVKESFLRAKDIDIVVTSMASALDKHGELNQFINIEEEGQKNRGLAALKKDLKKAAWVGDVSYRPYSNSDPIATTHGIRAVSLFELQDLVELAAQPKKYVILVAAPCGVCKKSKGTALQPLLASRNLKLWTHLYIDLTTAQSLLPIEA